MNIFLLIPMMIFFHIVDDFYLQGILAKLKQRDFWVKTLKEEGKNLEETIYKNDYIVGLFMHGLSWAFMIMIPVAIYCNFNLGTFHFLLWFFNAMFHTLIDDAKANKKEINLITDQLLHLLQIGMTIVFVFLFKALA